MKCYKLILISLLIVGCEEDGNPELDTFTGITEIDSDGNIISEDFDDWYGSEYRNSHCVTDTESESEITEEKLTKIITKTVSNHLEGDRNFGLFLSGGTDSTMLALYAKEISKKNFNIFTYDFLNSNVGESIKSQKIAKELNLVFNKVVITPQYIIDNFDKVIKKIEAPITSIRLFGVEALYQLANKKNVSVILEGHGGDEMMGGYDYNYYSYLKDLYNNDDQKIKKFLLKSFTEKQIQNFQKTFKNQGLSTTDATPFFNKNFFHKDFYIEKKFKIFKSFINLNNLKKSQIQDINLIKIPRVLQFTDRLSMSYGIETRVPFLDNKLFELCFSLKNKSV